MPFPIYICVRIPQVVEVLTESLTLKETSIPTKVARLMLASDILHNSSAPVKNASAYRTKFEAKLPDIMESFSDLYRSITGRITAEALKVLSNRKIIFHGFLCLVICCCKLILTFCRNGFSKYCKYGQIGFSSQTHTYMGYVPHFSEQESLVLPHFIRSAVMHLKQRRKDTLTI